MKQLTVDTKWWTRYRDALQKTQPTSEAALKMQVPDLAKRARHPAIPLSNDDLVLQCGRDAIDPPAGDCGTAGFHFFAFIEQGGSSLYPALAQKVTNLEVPQSPLEHRRIGDHAFSDLARQGAGNAPKLTDGNLSIPGSEQRERPKYWGFGLRR